MSEPIPIKQLILPVLPLRDVVVYPYMVLPLIVGRASSMTALQDAIESKKQIFLVAQKNSSQEEPNEEDLFRIGTVANPLQALRLPDGTMKVLIEGGQRAQLKSLIHLPQKKMWRAKLTLLDEFVPPEKTDEITVLMRRLVQQFEILTQHDRRIPEEIVRVVQTITQPGRLCDCIAAHLHVALQRSQQILECLNIFERLDLLHLTISEELELLEVEKRIQGRVKRQVESTQRQYYLSEKIKAIQKELGELSDGNAAGLDEIQQLTQRVEKAGMPKEALEKAHAELAKLKMMSPMSAEAAVCRNYLEWLVDVPWQTRSELNHDLVEAQKILDRDHYGLEKVKDRILEYLAVLQRVKKMQGTILCLVGPPGVGKTSLGRSIASATGREFIRVSLGGVRDEAEIRGHRRTYVGALPGRIIQKMAKVKVKNPLFMLDEIDKMSMDFRGDPSSALLEVLDPEQNNTFNDHFLEVDYDLSEVMFIATANSLNIPTPLLDRMEVIELSGYTEFEKTNIAERYLLPKEIERAGLLNSEINFQDSSLLDIIRYYAREAGVRNLEREIAKICRKVVKEILLAEKPGKAIAITPKKLEHYLGVRRYRFGVAEEQNQIGQVTGLAWTQVGGELLTIEAQIVAGKGLLNYTGSLGEVMRESIQAAMTVVKSRGDSLKINPKLFKEKDFHVHVPEGATPKDGPSAGVGMATVLASILTLRPIRADVAMTGEITLRGEVLPIGGLKEKLLAALRGGIKEVIIPKENESQLKEFPQEITRGLVIHAVRWIDEVWALALTDSNQLLRTRKPILRKTASNKKLKRRITVKNSKGASRNERTVH